MIRSLLCHVTYRMSAFADNRRGAALIEFALIAPLFILILLIVFQIGMIGWAKSTLETAARDAARFAITGAKGTGATREASLIAGIEERMSVFTRQPSTPITVTSKVYPTFEDIGQPEKIVSDLNGNAICDTGDQYIDFNDNSAYDSDMAKTGYGGPNDVVLYKVTYPLQALVPLNEGEFNLGSVFTLHAEAAVQNEPFGPLIPPPVRLC
jgi:Flp pilus assembly pilin Flp